MAKARKGNFRLIIVMLYYNLAELNVRGSGMCI